MEAIYIAPANFGTCEGFEDAFCALGEFYLMLHDHRQHVHLDAPLNDNNFKAIFCFFKASATSNLNYVFLVAIFLAIPFPKESRQCRALPPTIFKKATNWGLI